MKADVIPVEIKGIVQTGHGCAVFIGNDEKVFVIHIDSSMGAIIKMFMNKTPKERPLTHDLMINVMRGFDIKPLRVVITELKNSTYYARLYLHQSNELGMKIVEIDARPSDCLAIATAVKCPIFVSASLFSQVEDMSKYLPGNNPQEESE